MEQIRTGVQLRKTPTHTPQSGATPTAGHTPTKGPGTPVGNHMAALMDKVQMIRQSVQVGSPASAGATAMRNNRFDLCIPSSVV
eukprot:scaffold47505_cov38-Prasinocladus_malaysianus.AAC.1